MKRKKEKEEKEGEGRERRRRKRKKEKKEMKEKDRERIYLDCPEKKFKNFFHFYLSSGLDRKRGKGRPMRRKRGQ